MYEVGGVAPRLLDGEKETGISPREHHQTAGSRAGHVVQTLATGGGRCDYQELAVFFLKSMASPQRVFGDVLSRGASR